MKLQQINEGWLPNTPWDDYERNERKEQERQLSALRIAYERSRNTIRYNNNLTPVVFVSASNAPVQQDHIFIVSGADVDTVRSVLFEYDVEIDDIEGFQRYYGADLGDMDPEEWDAKVIKIEFKDLEPAIIRLLSQGD